MRSCPEHAYYRDTGAKMVALGGVLSPGVMHIYPLCTGNLGCAYGSVPKRQFLLTSCPEGQVQWALYQQTTWFQMLSHSRECCSHSAVSHKGSGLSKWTSWLLYLLYLTWTLYSFKLVFNCHLAPRVSMEANTFIWTSFNKKDSR